MNSVSRADLYCIFVRQFDVNMRLVNKLQSMPTLYYVRPQLSYVFWSVSSMDE